MTKLSTPHTPAQSENLRRPAPAALRLVVSIFFLIVNSAYVVMGDSGGCRAKLAKIADDRLLYTYFRNEPDADKPKEQLLQILWELHPEGFYIIHRMNNLRLPLGVGGVRPGGWKRWITAQDIDQQLVELGVAVHETLHEYNQSIYYEIMKEDLGLCLYTNLYSYYIDRSLTVPVVPNWDLNISAVKLKDIIPPRLRTERYAFYIYPGTDHAHEKRPSGVSDYLHNGIYFFLDEFDAYYHSTLYHYVMLKKVPALTDSSIATSTPGFVNGYAEFKFYILTMLLYAKEKHPAFYKDIMANKPLRTVFTILDERYFTLAMDVIQLQSDVLDEFIMLMDEMEKPEYQAVLKEFRIEVPGQNPAAAAR